MEYLTLCQYQLLELMFTNMNKDNQFKGQLDRQIIDNNYQTLNKLKYPLKINTSIPTHQPKDFMDCFWVRDNAGTKELYIFVGNAWEQII